LAVPQLGFVKATVGLEPNPAPEIMTLVVVPAVNAAGVTVVMLTGSTSVMLVVALIAGLLPWMVAVMMSVAVFDVEKSAVDELGAV
jgi:hypothetical protein